MNEQETREKMIECMTKVVFYSRYGREETLPAEEAEKFANALIAENIGDTGELFGKIEQLEAENTELRAKLKELGGLTTYKIIYDGVLGKFFISKYTEKYEFIGNFDNEQEAELKLAELKGEK